jgi:hypothetical protein
VDVDVVVSYSWQNAERLAQALTDLDDELDKTT